MADSKLVKQLKTFSPDEMKAFVQFAQSPFFNTKKEVADFVELMGKSLGLFEKIDNQILEPLPWQD